jgi:hypothetical protein
MLDPEAVIVKGGILALATLAFVRIILYEINNIRSDFRRRRRRH